MLGAGVEGDVGVSPTPFNFLAPERRDRPATSRAVVVARLLALLAGALAVAALLYPLWQKREAVIELQPRLEVAKAGADVADRLTREIEKLAGEHNFLVSRKQGQYPAVVLLEDLSRLLPDATWVQQLDIKSGPKIRELQISGESGSSSQLVEILEKSGSLANANFKSPLTKGVTPGTERFLLAAEVKPRALPEPLPDSALAPAADPGRPGSLLTDPAPSASSTAVSVPQASPSSTPPQSSSPAPAAVSTDEPPVRAKPATKG
jgi:general secretion pathway protein L